MLWKLFENSVKNVIVLWVYNQSPWHSKKKPILSEGGKENCFYSILLKFHNVKAVKYFCQEEILKSKNLKIDSIHWIDKYFIYAYY